MPKDFFNISNVTSLKDIPPGGTIHIIGVCGVAMAQLAVLLTQQGYKVSGSDKEFYEPMGSLLKRSPVKLFTGYDANNVASNVDLVVIGNAISYGNPEVDVVEQKNLPYTCFPKILDESVIANRHSIVVSGTHGKSTTTAIVASMLDKMGLKPSYFIGGVAEDLPLSLHADQGQHCVLEGDEYDSAFFAKVPKFAFYHPNTCIVNAVEFDHADIYPNIEAINKEFDKLVLSMQRNDSAICCLDFENLANLIKGWKQQANCNIITFGENKDADFVITDRKQTGLSQTVEVNSKTLGKFSFNIPMAGAFNAKNALASLIVAHVLGLDLNAAKIAISNFKRVKRRQEVRFEGAGNILIEDFAHHPTAVFETVKAVKEAYPEKRLWAVFEPRSNTSRRKVFQNDYIKAFQKADQVILCNVVSRGATDLGQELLDVSELSNEISKSGIKAECFPDPESIKEHLLNSKGNNDVILVMSNGSFGGLIQGLEDSLRDS